MKRILEGYAKGNILFVHTKKVPSYSWDFWGKPYFNEALKRRAFERNRNGFEMQ